MYLFTQKKTPSEKPNEIEARRDLVDRIMERANDITVRELSEGSIFGSGIKSHDEPNDTESD